MKLSRDSLLGIAILFLLVVVMSAAVVQQSNSAESDPYLSTSSAPNGTLAFKLWMNELGYSVFDEQLAAFNPPDVDTIFIVQPFWTITDAEWLALDRYVEDGGTLVLAGDNFSASASMRHYDFSQTLLATQVAELSVAAPLLTSPIITSNIQFPTDTALFTQRADYAPLLMAESEPVVVSFRQGRGRVILSASPKMFANINLKNDSVAAFMLNLIALAPKGSVWFDEWHHGIQTQRIVGPDQWLQRTPGGHAVLFTVLIAFVGLLLQGKAFGRAVPLLNEIKRRGPLEHVTAIANLKRKAGHRREVLQQYHQRVKRQLGGRYRLDPSMPDADYVNALFALNPSINKDEVLDLLKRLSKKNASEAELVKLASEAAKWMKD